jgi:hypothetical protein
MVIRTVELGKYIGLSLQKQKRLMMISSALPPKDDQNVEIGQLKRSSPFKYIIYFNDFLGYRM